jgi:hypothetical protein
MRVLSDSKSISGAKDGSALRRKMETGVLKQRPCRKMDKK